MVEHTNTTRRSVLGSAGAALVGATGTATGQPDQTEEGKKVRYPTIENEKVIQFERAAGDASGIVTRQPDQAEGKRRGRHTTAENGIVIQFEDCYRAHLRGDDSDADHVAFVYQIHHPDFGFDLPPGGVAVPDPDFPLSVDIRNHVNYEFSGARLVLVRVFSEATADDSQRFIEIREARIPQSWECGKEIVK